MMTFVLRHSLFIPYCGVRKVLIYDMMESAQAVESYQPGFSFQDLAQCLAHSAKLPPFLKKLVFEYPVAMPPFLDCSECSSTM